MASTLEEDVIERARVHSELLGVQDNNSDLYVASLQVRSTKYPSSTGRFFSRLQAMHRSSPPREFLHGHGVSKEAAKTWQNRSHSCMCNAIDHICLSSSPAPSARQEQRMRRPPQISPTFSRPPISAIGCAIACEGMEVVVGG